MARRKGRGKGGDGHVEPPEIVTLDTILSDETSGETYHEAHAREDRQHRDHTLLLLGLALAVVLAAVIFALAGGGA